jgi:uncharacterized membrane protein
MKKHFITGIAILLPITLTIVIVTFIVNILTAPFMGVVQAILIKNNIFQNGLIFLTRNQITQYVSQAVILMLLFGLTVGIGWLTRWFFINYFLNLGDYIIHRIPLINTIYKTSQDVIKTIFGTETRSFKQVALVPFPNKDILSLGLVTRENVPGVDDSNLIAVFVPTTPNPTSGFMMLFKPEQITYLDMPIENAFKYIISCGVISSPFKRQASTFMQQASPSPEKEKEEE